VIFQEAKVIIIHIFAKATRFNQSKKDMKFTLLVVGRTVEKHYITAITTIELQIDEAGAQMGAAQIMSGDPCRACVLR
jgi:hypothetical protein